VAVPGIVIVTVAAGTVWVKAAVGLGIRDETGLVEGTTT
jgi:hypothetical protein